MVKNKNIIILVHELSANPIVRAYPLAQYLRELGHSVTIAGLISKGKELYQPYKNIDIEVFKVETEPGILNFLKKARVLINKCSNYDMVYACKPLVTTFGIGLICKLLNKRQMLFLDVEDYELVYYHDDKNNYIQKIFNRYFRGFNKPNHIRNLKFLHRFRKKVDGTTVSSELLKNIYGGIKIFHGPNEKLFFPKNSSYAQKIRQQINIPEDRPVLLFAGFPHKHKGLDSLVSIIQKSTHRPFLLTAGPDYNYSYSSIGDILDSTQYKYLGIIPNEKMPDILSACDVVPILQMKSIYTEAQLPGKLIEALCMEKIVVANSVGDLSKILDDRCGIIVEDTDQNLLETFNEVFENLELLKKEIGSNARNKFLRNFSKKANVNSLKQIL